MISFSDGADRVRQDVGGVKQHTLSAPVRTRHVAFTMLIQAVIGFFATAGAAGTDFGMNSRNEGDVRSAASSASRWQSSMPADCRYFRWPERER